MSFRVQNNALVIGFPEGGGAQLYVRELGTLWELCNKYELLWWGKCGDMIYDAPTLGENVGTLRLAKREEIVFSLS